MLPQCVEDGRRRGTAANEDLWPESFSTLFVHQISLMLSDLSRLEERRVHGLQSCKNSVVFQFSSHRYRSLIDALFQLLAIYVAVEVQSRKNDVSICLVLPVFVVVFGCQLEFMSLQSRCILTARHMKSSVLNISTFFKLFYLI